MAIKAVVFAGVAVIISIINTFVIARVAITVENYVNNVENLERE